MNSSETETMHNSEYYQAVNRLWKVIPIGYGRDFNLVLKEVEHLRQMLDNDDR